MRQLLGGQLRHTIDDCEGEVFHRITEVHRSFGQPHQGTLNAALQTVAKCLRQLMACLVQLAELLFQLADHFPDFVACFTRCVGQLLQLREVALDFIAHLLVEGDKTLPPLNFTEQTALNLRLNAGFLLGLIREQVVQLFFEVIDADFGFSDRQQFVEPVQPRSIAAGFKLTTQIGNAITQLQHRCASGVAGIAHILQLQLEVLPLNS